MTYVDCGGAACLGAGCGGAVCGGAVCGLWRGCMFRG